MTRDPAPRWVLVVPVKEAHRAKTRLAAPHPLSRPRLARAVALDTLEQVCRALPPGQVVVVTSDEVVAGVATTLGAQVVRDPGWGLDAAVTAGWAWAGASPTGAASPAAREGVTGWAVLLGDLPALRAEDLRTALAACAEVPAAVVPDAEGTGTVLLTALGTPPEPRFGPGSAARHGEHARRLELDLPRLRRDVDTVGDLAEAVALGVGARTGTELGLRAAPPA